MAKAARRAARGAFVTCGGERGGDDGGGDDAERARRRLESVRKVFPMETLPFVDFRPRRAQGVISRKPRVSADC